MTRSSEDVCVWADGTWCLREEVEEYMMFMSDDYRVIPVDSPEYDQFLMDNQ